MLVLELATEFQQSGVDMILDKWDLKEGHDAYAFMEQMVTDPEIEKVILIYDNFTLRKRTEEVVALELKLRSYQERFTLRSLAKIT
jgi:hypothetical protein